MPESQLLKEPQTVLDDQDLKVIIYHVFAQVREDLKSPNLNVRKRALSWISDSSDQTLSEYLRFVGFDEYRLKRLVL